MLQIGNSLGTSSDYKIKPKKETRVAKESTLWKNKGFINIGKGINAFWIDTGNA